MNFSMKMSGLPKAFWDSRAACSRFGARVLWNTTIEDRGCLLQLEVMVAIQEAIEVRVHGELLRVLVVADIWTDTGFVLEAHTGDVFVIIQRGKSIPSAQIQKPIRNKDDRRVGIRIFSNS